MIHKILRVCGFILYSAAFITFSTNIFFEIAYNARLDLTGFNGAVVLTAFLGVGLVIQILKMINGLPTRLEFISTALFLFIHVAIELYIWVSTQYLNLEIPRQLPLTIVMSYWIISSLELLIPAWEHNLKRLAPDYKTPEQRLIEQSQEVELLRQRLAMVSEAQEKASARYQATCEHCGAIYAGDSDVDARNKLARHVQKKHNGVILPANKQAGAPIADLRGVFGSHSHAAPTGAGAQPQSEEK